jgi:hypothetical protein
VGHVVKERHCPDDLLFPKGQIPAAPWVAPVTLPDGRDQFPRHVVRAQGVLEPRVLGPGVHMERGPELTDPPQALDCRSVEKRQVPPEDENVPVHRIANGLGVLRPAGHGLAPAS